MFQTIINSLGAIVRAIASFFDVTIHLLTSIPKYVNYLISLIGYLPVFIVPVFTLSIIILIILRIVKN